MMKFKLKYFQMLQGKIHVLCVYKHREKKKEELCVLLQDIRDTYHGHSG